MSSGKITVTSPGPILSGTVSTVHAKCGRPTCRCYHDRKYLHRPYYRWSGRINGRHTTRTISEEIARECQKRIENYEELLRKIDQAVANALDQAPWMQGRNK